MWPGGHLFREETGDYGVKQRQETLGNLSDKKNIEFYRGMKLKLTV